MPEPQADVRTADAPTSRAVILAPGHNCWRIERARQLGFLIDGEQYFSAVRYALAGAEHSIFILGWDIDSRMRLVPSGANDGFPEPLGEFLQSLVEQRPALHTYILSWDFALLFAFEREWLASVRPRWRTDPRLRFSFDGRHPPGASHHQKIIVVDDTIAFVSGFDLTLRRWDTQEHRVVHPLRVDPHGKPYHPFHDAGVIVEGDVARALGELARDRWQRAMGTPAMDFVQAPCHGRWPTGVVADLQDIDVAISRTDAPFNGRAGVHELRQLHLDAIAHARRFIYAENQYFTGRTIANALAASLAQASGPEIVIVSPVRQSGWLEVTTMGVLRARLHQRLREADVHGRYRLYSPHLPLIGDACLNVHSKVFIVDDEFAMIGSANLSDRSMGMDSECNLAIEAGGDERIAQSIATLRSRLVGEHVDRDPSMVAVETAQRSSLIDAIETLSGPGRSLRRLEPELDPEIDIVMPDHSFIDPDQPFDPDEAAADLVPYEEEKRVAGRIVGIALIFVLLAALALAWRYTPLQQWANLEALVGLVERYDQGPLTPLAVMLAYVVGGFLVLPVTLMAAVTGAVFGPVLGAIYAISGATLSAFVSYTIGRKLGRDALRRLAGKRLNELSMRFARRGLVAMIFVRILPIAPFTIVNIVAGASHIRLLDFILGTIVGLAPGTALIVVFVDRIVAAIRSPGVMTSAFLLVVVTVVVGLMLALRQRIAREHSEQDT